MRTFFIILLTLFCGSSFYFLWIEKIKFIISFLIFAYLSYMALILLGYKNGKSEYINKKGEARDTEV